MFQSAPLTEARGDSYRASRSEPTASGFNPLPSPKQGETYAEYDVLTLTQVSIRSPHRSKGRHTPGDSSPFKIRVSIRSPHRSKGRQGKIDAHELLAEFQSAPLTEARGDLRLFAAGSPGLGFNPLPSPKQGETHRSRPPRRPRHRFNPLPSPKQGETRSSSREGAAHASFNPLPSPKQGETESKRPPCR